MTFSTNTYQLVFMEMPTAVKFVLIVSSDQNKSNEYFKQCLREMYRQIYVEYFVKNPIRCQDNRIDSQLFREKLLDFFSRI